MRLLFRFKWPIFLLLIGTALLAVGFGSLFYALRENGTQFLGPGETTVTITKPGDYTLWRESKTIFDGQLMTFPDDLPSGTTIKVIKEPEGTVIPLQSNGTCTMESGSTRRASLGDLTFTNPGQYKVQITGLTEKRAFYLNEARFWRAFGTLMICLFAGVAFLFIGFIAGIIVLIQVLSRRT